MTNEYLIKIFKDQEEEARRIQKMLNIYLNGMINQNVILRKAAEELEEQRKFEKGLGV